MALAKCPCPRNLVHSEPQTFNHELRLSSTAMSITNPNLIRCCARTLRSPSRPSTTATSLLTQHRRRVPARRCASTAAASSGNSKVAGIVDQISQLTLLETADLVSSLKVCLPKRRGGRLQTVTPRVLLLYRLRGEHEHEHELTGLGF